MKRLGSVIKVQGRLTVRKEGGAVAIILGQARYAVRSGVEASEVRATVHILNVKDIQADAVSGHVGPHLPLAGDAVHGELVKEVRGCRPEFLVLTRRSLGLQIGRREVGEEFQSVHR